MNPTLMGNKPLTTLYSTQATASPTCMVVVIVVGVIVVIKKAYSYIRVEVMSFFE